MQLRLSCYLLLLSVTYLLTVFGLVIFVADNDNDQGAHSNVYPLLLRLGRFGYTVLAYHSPLAPWLYVRTYIEPSGFFFVY